MNPYINILVINLETSFCLRFCLEECNVSIEDMNKSRKSYGNGNNNKDWMKNNPENGTRRSIANDVPIYRTE
jgi:hypothetical protein